MMLQSKLKNKFIREREVKTSGATLIVNGIVV